MVIHDDESLALPLFERELEMRAVRIKLVATDVDGVLTDGSVYYSEHGEALKRFSIRDGMGVERLRADGIETIFVTREKSEAVARRAEKLKLPHCYLGVTDKRAALPRLLAENGVTENQVAYIGDDVNDSGIIAAIAPTGLVGAPLDAIPAILRGVHYRCALPGGHGAFRDFAEWILEVRWRARQPRAADAAARYHGQGGRYEIHESE
jgi:3-deoxy-D-manno-octulosonate 8-phosphate phosphatase (KDO 8-P phosphatase)